MKNIIVVVKNILSDDEGASMVEYAVGVGFIVAALVVAVALFGQKLGTAFGILGDNVVAGANGT